MSAYSVLRRSVSEKDLFVHEYECPDKYEYQYSDGVKLGKPGKIKLFYKSMTSRKTDFLAGVHSFPVVSGKLKEVLSGLADNLEFHPVELICTKTKESDFSYYLLNILDNVACFDWEKATYKVLPGMENIIVGVSRLAIDEKKLQGRDIARLSEIKSTILVSDRLREQIESAKLTGMLFQTLEEFTMPL